MTPVDEIANDALDESPSAGDPANGSGETADNAAVESVESPPVEPSELETKLREKEQLVSLLTQRLEQAAEQLDRARRNGSDRRVVAGGIPPELLLSQKQVLEDIGLAVERFEAANAAETLGRIENQLSEIRDLVSGGVHTGGGSVKSSSSSRGSGGSGSGSSALLGGATDQQSAWNAMKERMLAGDDSTPHDEHDSDSDEHSDHDESDSGHEPSTTSIVAPPVVEETLDPPDSVDVSTADREQLAAAVVARDEYIAHLLGRLRAREARGVTPVDWEALGEAAPEDLREHLVALETKLQETLRRAEVEQSLERARLGRVESELTAKQERIDKEIKRLNLDGESGHDDRPESEKGPRWMRMLGLGNEP